MSKDTSKIVEELGLCPDFCTFYEENREYMISESLAEMLDTLMKEKALSKASVIKDSQLSEIYAYQIFSGVRVPRREKLLSLAVAMGLDLSEVQKLLRAAGYTPLYVKIPFDSVVIYGICHHLSVPEINELLYEYELETLG